jgi:hypothetical protein
LAGWCDKHIATLEEGRFSSTSQLKIVLEAMPRLQQRGTNEQTNLLSRRFFPKGMDLTRLTPAELDREARRLNGTPRQTLGFKTRASVVNRSLTMAVLRQQPLEAFARETRSA